MKHEWKQTIFTSEDFNSGGQYIVREGINKENSSHIEDTGYLSTILKKIGWGMGSGRASRPNSNIYCIVNMSDGLVTDGYFSNTGKIVNGRYETPIEQWIWNEFSGESNFEAKQKLCDYLNNNPHGVTYRFATQEEVVRVVMYQKSR